MSDSKRILGIPERFIYQVSVLAFYLFLLFAVGFFSRKYSPPADQRENSPINTALNR